MGTFEQFIKMLPVLHLLCCFLLLRPLPVRAHLDYRSRNLQTIQNIYNLTVYPNFLPILQNGSSAVPPGLFNQNATGRITPIGNFTGFDDSIEYFFGLAPVPQERTGNGAIYEADVVEFTSACPEVAASVVYLRTGPVDPASGMLVNGSNTTALKQIAFWRFDDDGLVLDYDAWIPNLQRWTSVFQHLDLDSRPDQEALISGVCPVIQEHCTGQDQQYVSVDDCITQLQQKPFGTGDEAWGDNVFCRTIHTILTQVRPDVHCPHVGPNGGNGPDNYKCVDIDYNEYFADEKLFHEPQGETFVCPRKQYRE